MPGKEFTRDHEKIMISHLLLIFLLINELFHAHNVILEAMAGAYFQIAVVFATKLATMHVQHNNQ
jgi:hypothetical protein